MTIYDEWATDDELTGPAAALWDRLQAAADLYRRADAEGDDEGRRRATLLAQRIGRAARGEVVEL